ncbi:GDSL-type esterase/lipase family protein [Dysosmobacter sp. HCP28S3_G4]|uniref:GDSL-type esterase/lipase family protein n=1 Tax=Dysosmobacter sp. HCP28S3_G4 TaxID=3438938 RepID=UPI003F892CE3
MGKRELRRPRRSIRFLAGALLMVCLLLTPTVSAGASGEREAEPQAAPVSVSAEIPAFPTQKSAPEAAELPPEALPQVRAAEPEQPEESSSASEPDIPDAPVEDSYFEDAVFLGDSRTEGFHLYSGLETGQYLFATGATVESVFSKATQETEQGKVSMLDALDGLEFSKLYIMLGVNELGWPKTEQFHDQYAKLIDRVRESHPDARIALQSILPISAKQEAKGSYVNNGRIAEFNAIIVQLAEEKDCTYLDVASAVTGEDGCLRAEETTDGIHLNTKGCVRWLEYLKEHPI